MTTVVKIVEIGMYILGAVGIGLGMAGIISVCLAFSRKQDQLLSQRLAEVEQRRRAGTGTG